MTPKSNNEIIRARTNMNRAINAHQQVGFEYTQAERYLLDRVVSGKLTTDNLRSIYQAELQQLKVNIWDILSRITPMDKRKLDPYSYPGTSTLINKLGIKDPEVLKEYEKKYATLRLKELGENPVKGNFGYQHLKNIHRYIFQDVYTWAGQQRKADLMKTGTMFCSAQLIKIRQETVFGKFKNQNHLIGLEKDQFVGAAANLLGRMNYHPFREGNGRSQYEFMRELSLNAGYKLELTNVSQKFMIFAQREYLAGNPKELERIIQNNSVQIEQGKIKPRL